MIEEVYHCLYLIRGLRCSQLADMVRKEVCMEQNERVHGNGALVPQGPILCGPPGGGSRADGSNCGAPPGESGLCFWHDPERREERLEASRKGGSRRAIPLPVGLPLAAEEARGVLASVMAALLEGALDPGTARAAAYILQVDRKIAEGETVERQLSIIEELTQQRRNT